MVQNYSLYQHFHVVVCSGIPPPLFWCNKLWRLTSAEVKIAHLSGSFQWKCCRDSRGSSRMNRLGWPTRWEKMPKPNAMQSLQSQFKITEYMNYYMIWEVEITDPLWDWMKKPGHNVVFHRESVGEKNGQIVIGIRYYTRQELKIACNNNILHMGIIPVHVVLEFTSVMLNVQPTLLGHLRTCAEKSMINRYRVTECKEWKRRNIYLIKLQSG